MKMTSVAERIGRECPKCGALHPQYDVDMNESKERNKEIWSCRKCSYVSGGRYATELEMAETHSSKEWDKFYEKGAAKAGLIGKVGRKGHFDKSVGIKSKGKIKYTYDYEGSFPDLGPQGYSPGLTIYTRGKL